MSIGELAAKLARKHRRAIAIVNGNCMVAHRVARKWVRDGKIQNRDITAVVYP